VAWRAQAEGVAATIERSQDRGPWVPIQSGRSDRARRIVTEDPGRPAGAHLRYRLSVERAAGPQVVASTQLLLAGGSAPRLSLARIGGAPDALVVAFRLAAEGIGLVELYDLGGRRLARTTVRGGIDGRGTVELAAAGRLAPGVYLVRLTQETGEARLKTVVLR
jgi:hypothetical protein